MRRVHLKSCIIWIPLVSYHCSSPLPQLRGWGCCDSYPAGLRGTFLQWFQHTAPCAPTGKGSRWASDHSEAWHCRPKPPVLVAGTHWSLGQEQISQNSRRVDLLFIHFVLHVTVSWFDLAVWCSAGLQTDISTSLIWLPFVQTVVYRHHRLTPSLTIIQGLKWLTLLSPSWQNRFGGDIVFVAVGIIPSHPPPP